MRKWVREEGEATGRIGDGLAREAFREFPQFLSYFLSIFLRKPSFCNNCLVLCIAVLYYISSFSGRQRIPGIGTYCVIIILIDKRCVTKGIIPVASQGRTTVHKLYGNCKPTQAPLSTVITLSFVCLSEQTNYSCFIKLRQCLRQCNRYSLLPRCTASVLISNNADVSTSV